MSDPVPTTYMRCAVGRGHITQGADLGYGLDTVRGDAAHPVSHGLACGRGISETADPDEAVSEELVWLPIHHPATNRLTHSAVDPQSKEPNFKQCAAPLAPPPLNAAGGVNEEAREPRSEPPIAGVDP